MIWISIIILRLLQKGVYKSGVIPPDEIAGYVRNTTSNLLDLDAGDWWFDFKPWKIEK
jgi:hypothetical protein